MVTYIRRVLGGASAASEHALPMHPQTQPICKPQPPVNSNKQTPLRIHLMLGTDLPSQSSMDNLQVFLGALQLSPSQIGQPQKPVIGALLKIGMRLD